MKNNEKYITWKLIITKHTFVNDAKTTRTAVRHCNKYIRNKIPRIITLHSLYIKYPGNNLKSDDKLLQNSFIN